MFTDASGRQISFEDKPIWTVEEIPDTGQGVDVLFPVKQLSAPRPVGDLGRDDGGGAVADAPRTSMRPKTLDELLTPNEVAALLKVTKPWLYAQVQRGGFPIVRFNGRSLRFKVSDIQRYIDR